MSDEEDHEHRRPAVWSEADRCPECHMVGQHKLQCGQRTDGQIKLPATKE